MMLHTLSSGLAAAWDHDLRFNAAPTAEDNRGKWAGAKARDVMNRKFVSISPQTTIQDAIDMLLAHGVSGLPVLEQDGRLAGLLTDFALTETVYRPALLSEPVEAAMSTSMATATEADSLWCLANLFQLHRIRLIPILCGRKCTGIVTRSDLVRYARRHPNGHLASEAIAV